MESSLSSCCSLRYSLASAIQVHSWAQSSVPLATTAWWDQVTVAPELRRIAVFNKGTAKGFTASIPTGGHSQPNSIEGLREEWKKAQKKLKKKHTSETIKRIIPSLKPLTTFVVWQPWKVASLTISLNQADIEPNKINNPAIIKRGQCSWK